MNGNQSNSRLHKDNSRDDQLAALRDKQTLLVSLYESIRTDYVSLFQHLYEIDEPQNYTARILEFETGGVGETP